MEIKGRNVNDCYRDALVYLTTEGVLENSRNGRVLVAPEPVLTTYKRPTERVLFDPKRDANPFFHLMEALWMLAGEKHSAWPVQFNKQMAEYARDDGTYEGAYGFRWRKYFHIDQIQWAVDHLRANPESRRCVISMLDGFADRSNASKDIPCNTHLYLDLRGNHLNMTVCNRSNDAVWGAYGANAVHFSMLQEVIAAGLNVPVGLYRQFSNNLHIYVDIPKVSAAVDSPEYEDLYAKQGYHPFPLVKDYGTFLFECECFLQNPQLPMNYKNPFLYYVARPMYLAWICFKDGDDRGAYSELRGVEDPAWRYAAEKWLNRRTK